MRRNFYVSISISCFIYPLTAFVYFMDRKVLKVPLVLYASLYFVLSIGSVTNYIIGVYCRMKSVNEVLQLKLNESNGGKIVKVRNSTDEDTKLFVGLSKIYNSLMDVCNLINLCYGFQMMLGFGLVFFFTLFTIFTAYTDIYNDGRLTSETIPSLAFCVFYSLFLTSVVFTCSLLDKEVELRNSSENY